MITLMTMICQHTVRPTYRLTACFADITNMFNYLFVIFF